MSATRGRSSATRMIHRVLHPVPAELHSACVRLPAVARALRRETLHPGTRALHQTSSASSAATSNPDPSGRLLDRARRSPTSTGTSSMRSSCELDVPAMVHVQARRPISELPRHRLALHQRRHHRVHASSCSPTCSRTSRRSAESFPAWRRRAVPFHWGPLPRPSAIHEQTPTRLMR